MNIVTLTLNPAFDVHCYCENFESEKENFADITSFDAGGKGVNISRALCENGVENTAVIVVGKENGQRFLDDLKGDICNIEPIFAEGRIRENITVHTNEKSETRISFSGFESSDALLSELSEKCDRLIGGESIVTVTGSLLSKMDVAKVKALILRWKEKGAKVVIDSRSFSLSDLVELKPFLIKPNGEEISKYLGKEVNGFEDIIDSAKELHKSGIENVMVSLGSKGALLVCSEGAFTAKPPRCTPISTIGAGDSSIAGFVAAVKEGKEAALCLKTAMAYGNAACLTEGTRPPDRQKVQEIIPNVAIEKI